MIKINLLDSITDSPTGAAMMEEKVTSPGVQTLLLALTVFGLLFVGIGYDYISSRSAHSAAEAELENQQRINRQMLAVNKEQEDLQNKTRDIQVRIDAIQKLKASQVGPGPLLVEIYERFDKFPLLYLKSVQLKGTELTIKGESPNDAQVAFFGQKFEFSDGRFTDLNIEYVREDAKIEASKDSAATANASSLKPEVVAFTVKCNYNKPAPVPATSPSAPSNQVAKN